MRYPILSLRSITFLFLFTCLAAFFTSCESQRPIVNDLEEKEANEIIVFLSRRGVDAQKVKQQASGGGGQETLLYQITVSGSDATDAMAILNMHGLPRRKSQSLLNLFAKGGLVPSEMEEKIKYQAGLAEQIANTIRKIDGVLDADIQLSFPEDNPLNPDAEKKEKTASVYVKHQGVLDDPNSQLITKIRRLVASSIDGLKYENVTVIADRARFMGDPALSAFESFGDENKEYVNVWNVIVAKESVQRFRLVFFTFSIAMLIFGLSLIWMLWKIYPVMSNMGGIGQLFRFKPFTVHDILAKNAPKQPKVKKKEEKEEPEEDDKVKNSEDEDEG